MSDVKREERLLPSEAMIHITQQVYRKLLDVMARPGKVHSLDFVGTWLTSGALAVPVGLSPAAAAIAFTMLDGEVSFALAEEPSQEMERYLHTHTLSRAKGVGEADFVFASGSSQEQGGALFARLKKGTPTAPHQSATLILSVDQLRSVESERALKESDLSGKEGIGPVSLLRLRGPGVRSERQLLVVGLSAIWTEERTACHDEFPLGVDIILTAADGSLAALPRSTTIEEVTAWDMSQ